MKFDTPATTNPIDQTQGRSAIPTIASMDRLKTTGTGAPTPTNAPGRAAARSGLRLRPRRGHRQGADRLDRPDRGEALATPGVLAVVTHEERRIAWARASSTPFNASSPVPRWSNYRSGRRGGGRHDLRGRRAPPPKLDPRRRISVEEKGSFRPRPRKSGIAPPKVGNSGEGAVRRPSRRPRSATSTTAFAAAPFRLDEHLYDARPQPHAMMEPHATHRVVATATSLTVCRTSIQHDRTGRLRDLAADPAGSPRRTSTSSRPFIGGGFGGKGTGSAIRPRHGGTRRPGGPVVPVKLALARAP